MTPGNHATSSDGLGHSLGKQSSGGDPSESRRKSQKEGASSDEISLYADHKKIHPKYMPGFFRYLKNWANLVFMLIYFLTPWMRWDRGPGVPDQAILIDLSGRKAYFLWLEIWPQEIYFLTALLILAATGLFFATALLGRVWCGFACIQTVFTDIFVMVERWLEGDRNARIKSDRASMSARRFFLKSLKISIWTAISVATGFGWAAYFNDAPTLTSTFLIGEAGWGVYLTVAIVGGFCLLLAGWAREQVCIYMCPWPRFQASMFDEDSLVVTYEKWRGEPRGFAKKGSSFESRGHCVDCTLCVQVCPTGIDIRNGSQLACIGCGLCIDACDSMMDRYNLPRGLIAYDSTRRQFARARGEEAPYNTVRPRTIIYAVLMLGISVAIFVGIALRSHLEINILHERSPLFVSLTDGSIRNGYTLKVLNKKTEDHTYTLSVQGLEQASLNLVGGESNANFLQISVRAGSVGAFRVYVTAPQDAVQERTADVQFIFVNNETEERVVHRSLFAGP